MTTESSLDALLACTFAQGLGVSFTQSPAGTECVIHGLHTPHGCIDYLTLGPNPTSALTSALAAAPIWAANAKPPPASLADLLRLALPPKPTPADLLPSGPMRRI